MLAKLALAKVAYCIILIVISASVRAQSESTNDDLHSQLATCHRHGLDRSKPLLERIGEPSESVLEIFRDAGMSPVAHPLNDRQLQRIADAIAILPPLHQAVLQQRLRSISFVSNMPNTALTSTVNPAEPYRLFDITIRAEILEQPASEWIVEKESSCFALTDSKVRLDVDVGNITAIQYVFLHEATHVVDAIRNVTPPFRDDQDEEVLAETPFTAGIWLDRTSPVSQYQDRELMTIRFRRGGRVLNADRARDVYLALGKTPFVSLYGSCASTEDLAEFVTVYHMTQKLRQPFRISVYEGADKLVVHEPMASDLTRRRFELMKQFYDIQLAPHLPRDD